MNAGGQMLHWLPGDRFPRRISDFIDARRKLVDEKHQESLEWLSQMTHGWQGRDSTEVCQTSGIA